MADSSLKVDAQSIRSLAAQLRELAEDKTHFRSRMDRAGRLLIHAIEFGAFSGAEFIQLRDLAVLDRYKYEDPGFWLVWSVTQWLGDHRGKLSVEIPELEPEPLVDMGVSLNGEYGRKNFPVLADLIEHFATQSDQSEDSEDEDANTIRQASINARMMDHLSRCSEATGWSAKKWADFLECSKSTVAETRCWESLKVVKADAKIRRLGGSGARKGRVNHKAARPND